MLLIDSIYITSHARAQAARQQSIVSLTGMQTPVGQKCYTKLIMKDVVWDSGTKLRKLEEQLTIVG